jgi:CDP-diacylglycerol---glycerol-3-phosphate 3-phosphatidyltransferase
MVSKVDFAAAMLVTMVFVAVGLAFAVSAWAGRRRTFERLERERGLPLFGKAPLEAVYAAALPLGRGLAAMGVSANAVTVASAVLAALAGVLFALGHFGLGAAVAIVASLADALDGIIARETQTASRYGQILDTTVDRYVEALLFGGIAFLVRADALLFLLALAALVGGFMVSYASSVLREIGAPDRDAPMRRAHRLVYLLGSAVLVPFVAAALPGASQRVQLAPVLVALAAIAVVGNVSAVRRLLDGARPKAVSGASARVGRARAGAGGIDAAVASKSVSHP